MNIKTLFIAILTIASTLLATTTYAQKDSKEQIKKEALQGKKVENVDINKAIARQNSIEAREKGDMRRAAINNLPTHFMSIPAPNAPNTQFFYPQSYLVQMPAKANANDPLAIIDLYASPNMKNGTLKFYDGNKANDAPVVAKDAANNTDQITLSYPISRLQDVLAVLQQARGVVVVFDTQSKNAYLSTALSSIK